MRSIVLDIETTGLSFKTGHKIIEIGCVELINHIPSGCVYNQYINPERDIPMASQNIHGISDEKVINEPIFSEIINDFLEFIGDSELIIHNASFDRTFLNHELTNLKKREIKNTIVDTLTIARKKFPGSPASLDALCKRFNINLLERKKNLHGALIDAELLAKVYLELAHGGLQNKIDFSFNDKNLPVSTTISNKSINKNRTFRKKRNFSLGSPNKEDISNHNKYLKNILKKSINILIS